MNLQQETLCGFVVSTKRKAVWNTELEMVKQFAAICDEYRLKYVASGGTLLGVIRHNGFIPWDDDIDLMMPREDYEKFLTVAQSCLPEGLFLQCNKTEKNYPNGHAQIRNSNTACLSPLSAKEMKLGRNCGIFIDIFPYDDVPDDVKLRKKHAKKICFLKRICTAKLYPSPSFLKRIVKKTCTAIYFLFHSYEKTVERINALAQKYNGKTQTVALVSFMPGYEKNVWEKKWFEETELHPFEDIQIAIPKSYHDVLTREFSDYMQLPEVKGNGSIHGSCYFDTQKPYSDYRELSVQEIEKLIEKNAL